MPAETEMQPAPADLLRLELAIRRSQHWRRRRASVPGIRTAISSAPVRPRTSLARVRSRRRVGDGGQRGVAGRRAAARVQRAEAVDVDERRAASGLLGLRGAGEHGVGVAAEGVEGEQAA